MASLKASVEEAAATFDTDLLTCLFDDHDLSELLDSGLSLEQILAYAALAGHTSCIRDSLKEGAKVTPEVMHSAHQGGQYESYQLLIPAGLDANYHFGHEGGPLTEAVMANNVAWITLVLQSGANPNGAPLAGYDALEIAVKEKLPLAVVKLLVDHGSEFPRRGLAPLAAMSGDTEVIQYLLDNGIDPNERTTESHTVLASNSSLMHLAAEYGHFGAVNLLIHSGADIEARDSDGKTALDKASASGHEDVVNLLLQYGTSFAVGDSGGSAGHETVSPAADCTGGRRSKPEVPAKL